MGWLIWVLAIATVGGLWILVVRLNRRGCRQYDGTGDPAAGIVVFVEPVRWLFIVWGFVSACRGLRQAGLSHAIHLFQWSRRAGSLFVLPDLMRRHRLDAKAARLARLLGRLAAETPGSTIHLVGYSSGGYVALEAAKRASPGVPISRVIVLHGTVSPAYDLSKVTARAAVLNVYGPCDVFINGLGPLLFGTNDRVHGPACGLVGFRAAVPGLTQRSWRWRDIGEGYVGDHFTVMSRNWIARHIAPQLVGEGG